MVSELESETDTVTVKDPLPVPVLIVLPDDTCIGGTSDRVSHREGPADSCVFGRIDQFASGSVLKRDPCLKGFSGAHGSSAIEEYDQRSAHEFNEEGLRNRGGCPIGIVTCLTGGYGHIASTLDGQGGSGYRGN